MNRWVSTHLGRHRHVPAWIACVAAESPRVRQTTPTPAFNGGWRGAAGRRPGPAYRL